MLADFRFVFGAMLASAVLGLAAIGVLATARFTHQAKVGPLEASRSTGFGDGAHWNPFSDPESVRRFGHLSRTEEALDIAAQPAADPSHDPVVPVAPMPAAEPSGQAQALESAPAPAAPAPEPRTPVIVPHPPADTVPASAATTIAANPPDAETRVTPPPDTSPVALPARASAHDEPDANHAAAAAADDAVPKDAPHVAASGPVPAEPGDGALAGPAPQPSAAAPDVANTSAGEAASVSPAVTRPEAESAAKPKPKPKPRVVRRQQQAPQSYDPWQYFGTQQAPGRPQTNSFGQPFNRPY